MGQVRSVLVSGPFSDPAELKTQARSSSGSGRVNFDLICFLKSRSLLVGRVSSSSGQLKPYLNFLRAQVRLLTSVTFTSACNVNICDTSACHSTSRIICHISKSDSSALPRQQIAQSVPDLTEWDHPTCFHDFEVIRSRIFDSSAPTDSWG